jgi:dihydroflavonol-4-reductase
MDCTPHFKLRQPSNKKENGMRGTSFVTGANGHLGNNLVRTLLDRELNVVAGIRNPNHTEKLRTLGSRVVYADLLDKPSLVRALDKVDVLYQVGAVFKHWSPHPERDIYHANLLATRNVLEAAAETGVKKVIYVSSLGALDRSQIPITENGWNSDTANVYFRSKTDSEKLAWELTRRLGLPMVSVLPGAMVGPNCWAMTPTMSLLQTILQGKLSADPGFFFNFVDVRDVAEGCWQAAVHGKAGERYLLANENCTGVGEIVRIAQMLFPERKIKTPPHPPKLLLYLVASFLELVDKLRGREPELQLNYPRVFTLREECDISKARKELGFGPRPPQETIEAALKYHANLMDQAV